jgi:oxygen-dependent protoporphyrinogen oxidase
MSARRIAIIGGGIAGITAAWQIAQLDNGAEVTLYEASDRLGGTVETTRREGFTIEGGPDGWVSEKPWARDLAVELGLESALIGSLDADRVTYIVQGGKLIAMPDGMRMMVPTDLNALEGSPLFSDAARAAYAAEPARADALKQEAPQADESVSDFVRRHFGEEVLTKIGGPLLSGVFGGDVAKLSVQAVMPKFVEMERTYGSLVAALAGKTGSGSGSIFTSLTGGTHMLIERMIEGIPVSWLRLQTAVTKLKRAGQSWQVNVQGYGGPDEKAFFDEVLLAVPGHVAKRLLMPTSPRMAELSEMESSSAVLVALAFDQPFDLPRGFGFLVPEGEGSGLLAGTFVDQKFPDRVPTGSRLLRGFFGGKVAAELAHKPDSEVAARTLSELRNLLGPIPEPKFSVVRRWPRSLPQYGVGHLERMAELQSLRTQQQGLWLLGNAFHGVGLPDLIRDARAAAQAAAS